MSDNHLVLNNDGCIEYIPFAEGEYPTLEQEAAGKVFKFILPIAAAIILPGIGTAIAGALKISTGITAILGHAGFHAAAGAWGSALGSGIVTGALNAAVAYASGARGAAVWGAGILGGIGGAAHGLHAAGYNVGNLFGRGFGPPPGAPTLAQTSAPGPMSLTPPSAANASGGVGLSVPENSGSGMFVQGSDLAAGGAGSATGQAGGSVFRTAITANLPRLAGQVGDRAIAALTLAVQNGQQIAGAERWVAARRAELERMTSAEKARQYELAAQMYNLSQQTSPEYLRDRFAADTKVLMNEEHEQALREIQTAQGGAYDSGKHAAKVRQGRLKIGREVAAASNRGYMQGKQAQISALGAASQAYGGLYSARLNEAGLIAGFEEYPESARQQQLSGLGQIGGLLTGVNDEYPRRPMTGATTA